MYTRWDFKGIRALSSRSIIEPNLVMQVGYGETRKIAAMAEAYDVALFITVHWAQLLLASVFNRISVRLMHLYRNRVSNHITRVLICWTI